MIPSLYSQKRLPYRYLSSFLKRSRNIRDYFSDISTKREKPSNMIVEVENNEIVEKWTASEIRNIATQKALEVDLFSVRGALHFGCMSDRGFREWVSTFAPRGLQKSCSG
jgi:hypothetical protein